MQNIPWISENNLIIALLIASIQSTRQGDLAKTYTFICNKNKQSCWLLYILEDRWAGSP